MRIAIAGSSGTVGQHVVASARHAGHDVVALSRTAGVDLVRAVGLAERLAGADAVIDVTSTSSLSGRRSVAFFTAVTENLLAAEKQAGVSHHVLLSIVGAERVADGYYAGKAAQEHLVMRSAAPWSILRTTQFHEFARQTVGRGTVAGLQLVPTMRSQPVAAAEVAAELVSIAERGATALAPDLAGPREENVSDMVRRYLAGVGKERRVVQLPFPGRMGAAMRNGGLLPASGTRTGAVSFDDWLADLARP